MPVWLFLASFGAYILNGGVFPLANDAKGSMLFSLNALKNHSLSIEPWQAPADFIWRLTQPDGTEKRIKVGQWNSQLDALYRDGQLSAREGYYMVPSVHPGRYINTFGLGAVLTVLPAYAVMNLFTDLAANRSAWYYGTKAVSSMLVAGAVVLIFLTMRRFAIPAVPAAVGALTFGLGTIAWSVSSQLLWQQTPALFFLALGAWCLAGVEARPRLAAYCGMAFGMATLCRPTAAISTLLVGGYLLWLALWPGVLSRLRPGAERVAFNWRPFLLYALSGLPFALLLGAYNAYYLGSPFTSGQVLGAEQIDMIRKGADGFWQTPLAEGLAGLLFSPSRGLFVYSPVLALGLVGAVMAWKSPRAFAMLIPLQAAVVLDVMLNAKHFDWWGGLTYGPRRLVDTGVFLTLLMIPVIARVVRVRWMCAVFGVLLLYSVSVQVIGAWSYYLGGWENKGGMNIDRVEHRHRLWSWSDTQIGFHVTHFQESMRYRKAVIEDYLNLEGPVITSLRER
ncbi:MAG: hypothetical protein OXU96_00990 [Gammaproteobacteria bacterium]|nr:hypothetical protein [Gammaproteobacteria bacterium]